MIECWIDKKQHVTKISITEIRMLTWMYDNIMKDIIKTTNIRDIIGIVPIEYKLRENRLKLFGQYDVDLWMQ